MAIRNTSAILPSLTNSHNSQTVSFDGTPSTLPSSRNPQTSTSANTPNYGRSISTGTLPPSSHLLHSNPYTLRPSNVGNAKPPPATAGPGGGSPWLPLISAPTSPPLNQRA
eukprot:PhF_6_TR35238/c0_g1_i1/m.51284